MFLSKNTILAIIHSISTTLKPFSWNQVFKKSNQGVVGYPWTVVCCSGKPAFISKTIINIKISCENYLPQFLHFSSTYYNLWNPIPLYSTLLNTHPPPQTPAPTTFPTLSSFNRQITCNKSEAESSIRPMFW